MDVEKVVMQYTISFSSTNTRRLDSLLSL